jgi:hypothetical protein
MSQSPATTAARIASNTAAAASPSATSPAPKLSRTAHVPTASSSAARAAAALRPPARRLQDQLASRQDIPTIPELPPSEQQPPLQDAQEIADYDEGQFDDPLAAQYEAADDPAADAQAQGEHHQHQDGEEANGDEEDQAEDDMEQDPAADYAFHLPWHTIAPEHLSDIHYPDDPHPYAANLDGRLTTAGIAPQYGHEVDIRSRHATVQGVAGCYSTHFKTVADRPHQLVHCSVMADGIYWSPGTTVDEAERLVKNAMYRQGLADLLPELQGKEDHTAYIEVHPIQGTHFASSSCVLHLASPAAAHKLLSYQSKLTLKVFPAIPPAYGLQVHPEGLPVITKWPGFINTPVHDRDDCRVMVHCEAFVDHPKVVVHDVLLKLQRHLSAKFSTTPGGIEEIVRFPLE